MKKIEEEEARSIAQTLYRYDNFPAERIAALSDFREEHIRLYREQGYLIIDNVLATEEVEGALEEIGDIIHDRLPGPHVQIVKPASEWASPEEKELAVRKIENYVDHAPRLRQIAFHEAILRVIEKLLNDKPRLVGEQGLLKPPFGGGEKPWHQDMAYGGLFFEKQIVTIWIALDEAGVDNGCMHIIPRSHLAGGVPHYSIRDWQMCDSHVDVEKDIAVTLKPGGALFFSGLLQHGTPPNFSDKKRRALQLRYAPDHSKLMSKEAYRLMFTSELTDAEC